MHFKVISAIFLLVLLHQQKFVHGDSRIVGGNFADLNQFPHQVAVLKNGGKLQCGGSVITESWVLTAAHCLYDGKQVFPVDRLEVLAGVVDLNDPNGQRLKVKELIPHANYGNFFNDIGLIHTEGRFVFGDTVKPIALRRTVLPDGTEMVISGWGRTGSNENLSESLQFTTMKSIPLKTCTEEIGITYNGIICVVATESGSHGPCNGDSGGPATVDNELVGVANFARITCGVNPDGYANVTNFVQWVEDHITA